MARPSKTKFSETRLLLIPAPFNIINIFGKMGLPYPNSSWVTYNAKKILENPQLLAHYYFILLDMAAKLEVMEEQITKRKEQKKREAVPFESLKAVELLEIYGDKRLSKHQHFADPKEGLKRLKREVGYALSIVSAHVTHVSTHINVRNYKDAVEAFKKARENG